MNKHSILKNNKQIYKRRKLRRDQTKAEEVLWYELRDNRMGYKFRRQTSIKGFIADFYCHLLRFVIELDGPIHNEQKEYDEMRERALLSHGYHVLRFKNDEVLFEREKAMEKIKAMCDALSSS